MLKIPSDLRFLVIYSLIASSFFSDIAPVAMASFIPVFIILGIVLLGRSSVRADRLLLPIAINFGYWIVSGIGTGAIDVPDLLSFKFITGEGRIFLYYLPLVTLLLVPMPAAAIHHLRAAYIFFISFGLVVFAFKFAASGGHALFRGFTSSHHVLGALYGVTGLYFFVESLESRKLKSFALTLASLLIVLGSGSRMSLLAFVVAVVWILLMRRQAKVIVLGGIALTLVFVVGASTLPHFQRRVVNLINTNTVHIMIKQFTHTYETFEPEAGDILDRKIIGREHNILTRVALWASATKNFMNSPIVGLGFGRTNDWVSELSGVKGLVWVATDGTRRFNASQAHNSYFQIAQETGLVGLILMGWLWFEIFMRLRRIGKDTRVSQFGNLRYSTEAARGMVIFAAGCSLTGHALAAPAIGVPIMMTVGVLVSLARTELRKVSLIGAAPSNQRSLTPKAFGDPQHA